MAVLPDVLIFYLPDVVEVLHPVANIQRDQCTEFFRDDGFARIGAGGWRSPYCMIFSNGFSVVMVSIHHQLTACNDDLQRTSCFTEFPRQCLGNSDSAETRWKIPLDRLTSPRFSRALS
jgi:hypothetical protein